MGARRYEGLSADEQAELDRRANSVLQALDGATTDMCFSVLSAVTVHACLACPDPSATGLSFVGEFTSHISDRLTEIPTEQTVTTPAPPENTN